MAKPSEAPLAQERVDGRDSSTCEDVIVGHTILPFDAQDAPQIAHVKGVESVFLAHLGGPSLAAVEKRAEDACLLHTHLSVLRE